MFFIEMRCPICKKEEMIIVEYAGIEIDYCDSCHGVWFDEEELELLMTEIDGKLDHQAVEKFFRIPKKEITETRYRCPRCQKKMDKLIAASKPEETLLDSCPRGHGLWFDQGELAGVVKNLSQGQPGKENKMAEFLSEIFIKERPK